MNNNNSAAKAALAYTIDNYYFKGIGFVTIPIFSRIMKTAEFGKYNDFMVYEAILYILLQ